MVAIPCSLTHVSPTTTTLHGSVSARASAPFFSGGASFDKSVPNRHKRKFARFTKVRVFVILLRELGKEVRDKSFDNLLDFGRTSCRRRPAITVNSPLPGDSRKEEEDAADGAEDQAHDPKLAPSCKRGNCSDSNRDLEHGHAAS